MAVYTDELSAPTEGEKIDLTELVEAIVELYPPEVIITELQQISKHSEGLLPRPKRQLLRKLIGKLKKKKEQT